VCRNGFRTPIDTVPVFCLPVPSKENNDDDNNNNDDRFRQELLATLNSSSPTESNCERCGDYTDHDHLLVATTLPTVLFANRTSAFELNTSVEVWNNELERRGAVPFVIELPSTKKVGRGAPQITQQHYRLFGFAVS
jgi:hypothetical protein